MEHSNSSGSLGEKEVVFIKFSEEPPSNIFSDKWFNISLTLQEFPISQKHDITEQATQSEVEVFPPLYQYFGTGS